MSITDPYGTYYFSLEIAGTEVAHFRECSGLKSTAEVFEIEEGGVNGYTHKRVGRSKWENIVLKYATNESTYLYTWREEHRASASSSERYVQSGAIIQYGNDGVELRRYSFTNVWPVSWEGPSFNSGDSSAGIETLEIAHEGLTVE
jgi:phage tail-like protein